MSQPSRLKVSVLAPDLGGGGMTRVYLVAQALRKIDLEVEVVGCLYGEKIYPLPPENLAVTSVPGRKIPGFFKSIGQMLRHIDGDLIYAIKPRTTSLGIALLKRLQVKHPVMLDIDDWEMSWFGGDRWHYRPSFKQLARDCLKENGALRDPSNPFYLKQMESLIPWADAVTSNTRFLQNRFGGSYLPNAKDTDLFNPLHFDPEVSRAKYGLAGYQCIMFPGTARPHKGLEDALLAIEQLNRSDIRLVIVGGRKPDDYEDRLIQRWGRWIIKLPRFSIEQMPEVVAAAHAVIVPQRNEITAQAQFPLKLADGMAMSKPIIATRVGDIPEILGDTGFLVEAKKPDQIQAALAQILDDPVAAQLRGARARERCVKHYSLDALAATLTQSIQSLQRQGKLKA
jgi:glycosyltransferase involved in cell wall biosynthesis